MIKLILIVALLTLLIVFLTSRANSDIRAGKRVGIIAFFILAMTTIIWPELSNEVANALGVGRGADLLLYILTITFFIFVINQYLHNKAEQKRLISLARKIAISDANARYKE